tara:strand:+ start:716 stop:928 length:213 start_codon:yes stop_codon:yes gene_type:complete
MEMIIALLMFVDNEIKEHRLKPSMSACLAGQRVASRNVGDNIKFQCIKTNAQLEKNVDGSQSIKTIIMSK